MASPIPLRADPWDNVEMPGPVRILVLWEHPRLVSAEEARAWAESNVAPLRESESVERLELVPLKPTMDDYAAPFDWLLELRVGSRAEGAALVREGPLGDFLGELRSLALRPTLLVADKDDVLRSER